MIIVPSQILFIYKQIMIPIQLPKFAVYDVEMLVAEVGRDLIDVLLLLKELDDIQQIWPPQLRDADLAGPRTIDAVEDPGDDGVNVTRMELGGFFEESQAGMGFHHVLHQRNEIFRAEPVPPTTSEDVDETWSCIVTRIGHAVMTNIVMVKI